MFDSNLSVSKLDALARIRAYMDTKKNVKTGVYSIAAMAAEFPLQLIYIMA